MSVKAIDPYASFGDADSDYEIISDDDLQNLVDYERRKDIPSSIPDSRKRDFLEKYGPECYERVFGEKPISNTYESLFGQKFNPYHDLRGLFTSGESAGRIARPGPEPSPEEMSHATEAQKAWQERADQIPRNGSNRAPTAEMLAARGMKADPYQAAQLMENWALLQHPARDPEEYVAALQTEAQKRWGGDVTPEIQDAAASAQRYPVPWQRKVDAASELLPVMAAQAQDDIRSIPGLVQHGPEGDYVVLYRGAYYPPSKEDPFVGQSSDWHPSNVDPAPLKSWTIHPDMAMNYGMNLSKVQTEEGGTGYLLSARVPVSRIASTALGGMGLPQQGEIVVSGGPMRANIRRLSMADVQKAYVRIFGQKINTEHLPAGSPQGGEFAPKGGQSEGSPPTNEELPGKYAQATRAYITMMKQAESTTSPPDHPGNVDLALQNMAEDERRGRGPEITAVGVPHPDEQGIQEKLAQASGESKTTVGWFTELWRGATFQDSFSGCMEMAASKKFGVPMGDAAEAATHSYYFGTGDTAQKAWTDGIELADGSRTAPFSEIAPRVLDAQYNDTQQRLQDANVSDLTLSRGMVFTQYGTPDELSGMKPGESKVITWSDSPLSSWTALPGVSREYASITPKGYDSGFIVSANVPAKDMAALGFNGMGRDFYGEVLVTGQPRQVRVERVR